MNTNRGITGTLTVKSSNTFMATYGLGEIGLQDIANAVSEVCKEHAISLQSETSKVLSSNPPVVIRIELAKKPEKDQALISAVKSCVRKLDIWTSMLIIGIQISGPDYKFNTTFTTPK